MPHLGMGLYGLREDKNMKMESNIIPTFFLYLSIHVTKEY